jgi:hypothetical protein
MAAKQKGNKTIEALRALVAPIKALLPGKDKSADDADADSETVEGADGTGKKPAGGKVALLVHKSLSRRTRIIIAVVSVAIIALISAGLRFALKAPPPLPQLTALEVHHQALEEEQAAAKVKQDAERKKLEQQEAEKSKPALVTRKPAFEVAARDRKNGQIVSESDGLAKPAQPAASRAINQQGDCNLVGNVKTIGEVLRRCIREFNGQDAR